MGRKNRKTNPHVPAQTKRIVTLIIVPTVSRFKKCFAVNRTARIGNKWITHFQRVFVKHCKELGCACLFRVNSWIRILVNRISSL